MIYRIRFETVHQSALKKYCNADPAFYKNVTQIVPNSLIPDEDWYEVLSHETDDPWQQYHQLQVWEAEDREFIRNVRLEHRVTEPKWEPVPS